MTAAVEAMAGDPTSISAKTSLCIGVSFSSNMDSGLAAAFSSEVASA